MKRIIGCFLCLAMLFALVACQPKADDTDTDVNADMTKISNEEMDIKNPSHINWYGRTYETGSAVQFDYTCSGFEVRFYGTSLTATLASSCTKVVAAQDYSWINIYVDGAIVETDRMEVNSVDFCEFQIVSDLEEAMHTVKVLKTTEIQFSTLALSRLETDGYFLDPPEKSARKIEVYGDSITCGYGSVSAIGESGFRTATEDGTRTYVGFAAQWLGAQLNVIGYSGWRLGSYWTGQEGKTVPDVYDRIYSPLTGQDSQWSFAEYVPDVVVINLGTNDVAQCAASMQTGGRFGDAEGEAFMQAYREFIADLQKAYPNVQIICCGGCILKDTIYWEEHLVDALRSEGNKNVHYVELKQTIGGVDNGTDGHPHWTSHFESAGILYTAIKNIMGW